MKSLTKEIKIVLVRDKQITSGFLNRFDALKKTKGKSKQRKAKKNQIIRIWTPSIGEIVWAKMRGYALWPANYTYSLCSLFIQLNLNC